MTAHSQADLRAQAAPERCRRCFQVDLMISPDQIRRYSCRKHQLMSDTCNHFVSLPFGREAEPIKPQA